MKRDSIRSHGARRYHTDALRMALLYASGLKKPAIGYAFYLSYGPVRRRIESLYQPLGIEGLGATNGRHQLALRFIKQGYLEHMYILMRLINRGDIEEAVRFVQQIEFDDGS